MSVTTLYLVRHGRTPEKDEKHDWDESLSKEGFRQASKVAMYFKNDPPDLVFSGTYRRAEEMAKELKNTLHKKRYCVITDSLLNEISRPLADGRPYTDDTLQKYFQWRRNVVYYPNEDNIRSRFMNRGESYWQFHQRGGQILQAFSHSQFANKKIAVYTHSQVKVTLKTFIERGPNPTPHQLMDPFRDKENFPPFGSITTVQFDSETGMWTILESNYTDHLK